LRGLTLRRVNERVFFRENKVVHYGEGGFGWMIIESDDDPYEVFGDYVPEVSEREERNYVEINEKNIEGIKYEIRRGKIWRICNGKLQSDHCGIEMIKSSVTNSKN
jgi:hypothetical protein